MPLVRILPLCLFILGALLPAMATATPSHLLPTIRTIAAQEGLDPKLLEAVIAAESNFDPSVISRKGAQGLMQLMPDTARDMGVKNPFDPEQNIRGGARYLRLQMERFSNLRLALAAYNAGPTTVSEYGGVPPYQETIDYVAKILAMYGKSNSQLRNTGRASMANLSDLTTERKIYRYRDSNGVLVLTDTAPRHQPGTKVTVQTFLAPVPVAKGATKGASYFVLPVNTVVPTAKARTFAPTIRITKVERTPPNETALANLIRSAERPEPAPALTIPGVLDEAKAAREESLTTIRLSKTERFR